MGKLYLATILRLNKYIVLKKEIENYIILFNYEFEYQILNMV